MSESSSSSSSSGRVTKLTAARKVRPTRHFIGHAIHDIPTEEKRGTAMRALAAMAISAVVVLILAAVAMKLYQYYHE